MDIMSGAIVLVVVVLLFFAVSYMSAKSKEGGNGCHTGCDGNCAGCSMNVGDKNDGSR